MDATALAALIQDAVPGVELEPIPTIDPQITLYAPAERFKELARSLRDRAELRFDVLVELTAVDFAPREPRFEVVYILLSIEHRLRLRLKVRLPGAAARIPTVSDVWPAANWLEREVWDLFGIEFEAHPDPRRLLMPEDWDGFPLRKDYPVQINMTPRTAAPLQVTEAEFRENVARDRLTRR
jgi:NADH-quinone oxidoreductase subunit C